MGSLNKSHNEADGGILLFNGELILLYCDSVNCEIGGKESFKGRVYLTTHRVVMIITPYRQNASVKSLCAPFCAITKCSVEQPIFGANYIEATVRDESDNSRSFSFKLKFPKGGAIELAMAMNRAVAAVGRNFNASMPPPPAYTPSPSAQYYQAPPTVYAPGYNCGVQMPVQQFPDQPPIGFIYASEAPPPYPGLNGQGGAPPPYQQQPGQGQGQNPGAYNNQQQAWPYPAAYPSGQQQPGYPQASGYPGSQSASGYPSSQPMQPTSGYPGFQPTAGYPGSQAQPASSYPGSQPTSGYPQPQPTMGYPQSMPQSQPQTQPQQPAAPSGYPTPQAPTGDQASTGVPQSSAGYPDLSQAGLNQPSGQSGNQNQSWPTAPSFNPNWQDAKK